MAKTINVILLDSKLETAFSPSVPELGTSKLFRFGPILNYVVRTDLVSRVGNLEHMEPEDKDRLICKEILRDKGDVFTRADYAELAAELTA